MTLPRRGTRKIRVAGKTYRWRLTSKRRETDARLVVETPDGIVWSTQVACETPPPSEAIPWTPADVRQFIEARLRGESW